MLSYLFLNMQSSANDSSYVYTYLSETSFWLELFHIVQFIIIPILLALFILFIILKFYKVLNEINKTLKIISDNMNKDD